VIDSAGSAVDGVSSTVTKSDVAGINPTTGAQASLLVGVTSSSAHDDLVDTSHVARFDSVAATMVSDFLKANPDSKIFYDHGNMFIYDGHTELDGILPFTIHMWESGSSALAIIGHADYGLA
jgi:hypothetical protein